MNHYEIAPMNEDRLALYRNGEIIQSRKNFFTPNGNNTAKGDLVTLMRRRILKDEQEWLGELVSIHGWGLGHAN